MTQSVKDIVLFQSYGGLGDNLSLSIIPELCNSYGINCYLSKYNAYRNDGIKSFLWERNSFLKGEKEDSPIDWLKNLFTPNCFLKEGNKRRNIIEATQCAYGLEPVYHYPKIYYNPNYIKELKDKVFIDLSAYTVSNSYKPDVVSEVIENQKLDFNNTINITHSNLKPYYIKGTSGWRNINRIKSVKFDSLDIINLEHYSDILYSCKKFITTHSGQASLASAIKNKMKCDTQIIVITQKEYMPENSCSYWYENTTYVEGN